MPTAPKSRWFRITQKRLLLLSLAFSFGPFKALDIYRPNKYDIFILYCISLGPHPLGVQCLLTSSMGVFPGDLNWTVLGSRLFPSPSISRCFSKHSSSPAIGFHSCSFFICTQSTLHLYSPFMLLSILCTS